MVNPNLIVDLTNNNYYHYCMVNSRTGYYSGRKLNREDWKTLLKCFTDIDIDKANIVYSNTRPYMVPIKTLIGDCND